MNNKTISGGIRAVYNINGAVTKPENIYVKELEFKNYLEFPPISDESFLFVATDEDAVYRFDSQKHVYICVARDYKEIKRIQSIIKEEK